MTMSEVEKRELKELIFERELKELIFACTELRNKCWMNDIDEVFYNFEGRVYSMDREYLFEKLHETLNSYLLAQETTVDNSNFTPFGGEMTPVGWEIKEKKKDSGEKTVGW